MRPRVTIARWMGLTAALAVNIALARAFNVQEMFCGVILIFAAMQVGFWYFLHSRGRARRFWLGFEIGGVVSTFAMAACELFPKSTLNRLLMAYTNIAVNLAYARLPAPMEDDLDAHYDFLLAPIYFVPEMIAAVLAGGAAVCLISRPRRAADAPPTI